MSRSATGTMVEGSGTLPYGDAIVLQHFDDNPTDEDEDAATQDETEDSANQRNQSETTGTLFNHFAAAVKQFVNSFVKPVIIK
jgi:hypothetical protein